MEAGKGVGEMYWEILRASRRSLACQDVGEEVGIEWICRIGRGLR